MQGKGLYQLVLIATCYLAFSPHIFGQKVSFGVITGAQLTGDFPTLACPDLEGSQLAPPPGCPRIIGGAIGVSDASRRFIIGPKVNLRFSPSLSLEVDALYRAIRTHNTTTFKACTFDQLPDCGTIVTVTQSSIGTEFTWEFPVLGRYQMSGRKLNPFIEGGPSFRPADNRKGTGVTAGAGFEMRLRALRLAPALRYTHWGYHGKYAYLGPNLDQLQFVLGVDGPPSTEPVSAFSHKISLGVVAGFALTDGLRTRTETHSNQLEIDPVTGVLVPVSGTVVSNSNRTSPVVGIATEIALPNRLSVVFSALYRPLNARDISAFSNGVTRENRFTVLTWEFPLLVKYKLPILKTRPFLELGPSFRASGNLNNADPSRHGITAGVGLELPKRGMAIAPTLRFTHWAADTRQNSMATHPNQVELVFGVRF